MMSWLRSVRTRIGERRIRAAEHNAFAAVQRLLDGERIRFIDVGAAGGIVSRWKPFVPVIAFTGIEPDERSYAELLSSEDAKEYHSYEVFPVGAWEADGPVQIHLTRKPECSSFYRVDPEFVGRFRDVERFEIVGTTEVECSRLATVLAADPVPIDFMKLDLEGGELPVIRGAEAVLGSCLGLHTEVCFQPLRIDQPLFGEVASHVGRLGFDFIDFLAIIRWERDGFGEAGQAIFADALFLRSPEAVATRIEAGHLGIGAAKRYLAILVIYERYDLALRFLDLVAERNEGFDSEYARQARAILLERREDLIRRLRRAERFSRLLLGWGSPHRSIHQLY